MEEDEYKEHIDDEEDVVLQLGDINNKERNNSNPFSHDRVTYHLWFYIFITTLIRNNDNDNNNNNNSQERALHLISSESLSNPLDDISSVGSIHQPNTATNSHDGIIVYEGTFTWNDLVECATTPGGTSYVKTTDGPTDISLSGKIGFYQSIDYKDVDGIPDGEGDHLFKEDKISLLPNQERAHLEFVGKTHITINGDLSDGATIECSGNNACDGAQINGEYIKEFNSDEDRACGQFSLSYINDEGKLEYIYILSALSKPQKHLPIPCNVSRSKSLNVSTIHNTNTKRISHSGSYTSQNIMMFISNSTPSETPPHKPINLPYPITLSPPLTSQHSGSGQSYSSNNNSRSSFTITGSMKNGNDNFYAINNGRHMEQLTEFGHQTIQTYR